MREELNTRKSVVNPIDSKQHARLTKGFYPIQFPGLIGVDIAGTVVKTGPKVEGFSVTATKCSLWRTISRLRQNQLKAPLGGLRVGVSPVRLANGLTCGTL
jgi:NADPH:quinone reductase-like Zn-dependent oxidoreductase